MKNFLKIADNLDVLPLLHVVQRRADLWNRRKWRTTYLGTPHAQVSDIWLRYSDERATSDAQNTVSVTNDIRPVWYPEWCELGAWARPLVFGLMARVQAYELGRVLITKLPPGGRILPHSDAVGAYTDQEDGARYHIVLQGLPGSLYRAGDETVNMRTGECWWFNHLAEHEIVNNSADDRVHLLVDTRNA
jgi:hypothetical protein